MDQDFGLDQGIGTRSTVKNLSFNLKKGTALAVALLVIIITAGCESTPKTTTDLPPPTPNVGTEYDYVIGPGDAMEIFVWGNEELSVGGVQVRPDGKISTRLVEDIEASGKTPTQLARDIEVAYGEYVKHPIVTVIVNRFSGVPWQQVRVVGEAAQPKKVPYNKYMTLLDLMIEVGGLTEYASGNKAVLIRSVDDTRQTIDLRLEDLLQDGDISADMPLYPGDIVMIPEAWF